MNIHFYRLSGGVLLIAIGLLIWLSNMKVIYIAWHRDWPVILIAVGVLGLIKQIVKRA